jgi:hypothetical protein
MQPESMVQKDGSKGIKFVMEHGPPPVRFFAFNNFPIFSSGGVLPIIKSLDANNKLVDNDKR